MSSTPATPLSRRAHAVMCLGALGVVFGDIGTSPLYTMRECLSHLPVVERTDGVLGVLSLMFWALMFEVSFKYLYSFLSRNARPVKDYYQILPTQIIEIGLAVQL